MPEREIVSTFGVERGEFAEVRSYGQMVGHFLDADVDPHGIGVVLESSEVCLGLRRVEVGQSFVVERRCLVSFGPPPACTPVGVYMWAA